MGHTFLWCFVPRVPTASSCWRMGAYHCCSAMAAWSLRQGQAPHSPPQPHHCRRTSGTNCSLPGWTQTAHTRTYTHTHMHARTRTHTHMHTRTHARTHTHVRMHAHAYTHTCTHVHTHAHTHAHTHTRMHTRTHARTHACTHARTHVCTHIETCTVHVHFNPFHASLRLPTPVRVPRATSQWPPCKVASPPPPPSPLSPLPTPHPPPSSWEVFPR